LGHDSIVARLTTIYFSHPRVGEVSKGHLLDRRENIMIPLIKEEKVTFFRGGGNPKFQIPSRQIL
jgi:hypothetical protein